jgi:signal transduction histidine kinase
MVMRRPDSVTATIALTVIVAMVLEFSLQWGVTTGLPYLGFERRQELPKAEERLFLQLPSRVAALLDILDRTPVADRSTVLAAAQTPQIRLRLLDTPAPNLRNRGELAAEVMRYRIEAALTAPRPVIVVHRYRLTDQKPALGGGRVESDTWIEAALSNGQWLLVLSNLDPPPRSDPVAAKFSLASLAAWLVLSLALAALLSVVAARRVVKPLSVLSAAVDHLGGSGDDPAIPPRGPREIEGIIRAFNRMRDRLRRFNEDRTRMMAAMSHDLRTPLTRLRMRIEMTEGLDDQQKMLDELYVMNGMVESILSFARDDARQEPRSLVDLSALVDGICQDAADAGDPVTFSGPRDVTISCRPTAMRRAISNLVDNAIKYGWKAAVTLAPDAGRAAITVEDEGPGIPRSEREKVFEPFYRIGSERNPDTGGVGLGLSVTRSIIWEHGGDITLGTRKGGGLMVRVDLPIGAHVGSQGRPGTGSMEPGTETNSSLASTPQ